MSVYGLDLGTANIVISCIANGLIQQLSIDGFEGDYPCIIYYNNKILFGRAAQQIGYEDPKYCFRNIKCLLGRKYSDPYVQHVRNIEQYTIVEGPDDSILLQVKECSKIVYKTPFELLSLIVMDTLNKLKNRLNNPIEYLAIAFPPSFNDIQKRELKQVIINTGIRHIETISETTAACYHFGYRRIATGCVALIVDCGAGTIDASLMEYKDGELTVIGHIGSSTIGGNLYTDKVISYVYSQLKKANFDLSKLTLQDHIKIQTKCEQYKIMLTNNTSVEVALDIEGFPTMHITQYALQLLCRDTNRKVVQMIEELIQGADARPSFLILSGKGMNLRCLADEICKLVGDSTHYMNIQEPVAHGLAMYMYGQIEKHHKDDTCNQMDTYTTLLKKQSPLKMDNQMHPGCKNNQDVIIPPFPDSNSNTNMIDNEDQQRDYSNMFASLAPLPPNPFTQSQTLVENFIQEIPVDTMPELIDEPVDYKWFDSVVVLESDESMDTSMRFNVNEKRSMDIRIGIHKHRLQKVDTKVLVSRNQQLPCHIKKEFTFGPKELNYNLYEGNSPYKKDCRRIRHSLLKRDEDHPPTQFWSVVLDLDVDKDGFLDMSFKWKDTEKEIDVIDKEIEIHPTEYGPLLDVPSSPCCQTRQLEEEV